MFRLAQDNKLYMLCMCVIGSFIYLEPAIKTGTKSIARQCQHGIKYIMVSKRIEYCRLEQPL